MGSEKNSDIFGYKVVLLETIAKEKSESHYSSAS